MASKAAKRFGNKGIDDVADVIFSGIEDSFIKFGTTLVTDLQGSLRTKGVTFGGNDSKLSNLIRFDIKQTNEGITFQLLMPEYGFAVDKGRGASKSSDGGKVKDNIREWVNRKGIVGKFAKENLQQRLRVQAKAKNPRKTLKQLPFEKAAKQLAFLISRKIHRKGYKGNNFYSEVIDKLDLTKLNKEISQMMNKEILLQIKRR
jgi:hypothetical protein